jgi:hypothetical protein
MWSGGGAESEDAPPPTASGGREGVEVKGKGLSQGLIRFAIYFAVPVLISFRLWIWSFGQLSEVLVRVPV